MFDVTANENASVIVVHTAPSSHPRPRLRRRRRPSLPHRRRPVVVVCDGDRRRRRRRQHAALKDIVRCPCREYRFSAIQDVDGIHIEIRTQCGDPAIGFDVAFLPRPHIAFNDSREEEEEEEEEEDEEEFAHDDDAGARRREKGATRTFSWYSSYSSCVAPPPPPDGGGRWPRAGAVLAGGVSPETLWSLT